MGEFEPLDLERVVWGQPLAAAVAAELERRGARAPLVVASPSCRAKTSVVTDLVTALPSPPVAIFDGIAPHVAPRSVLELADLARATQADVIVTVGGGSAIDTVKVALAALKWEITAEDQLGRLASAMRKGSASSPSAHLNLRQIVAPTTLSGAEFSDLAGCTDPETRVKQLFTARTIGAATVILDPAITLATPLDIWLSTGIRALDHAVETLCSGGSNPYADALSADAVTRLAASLRGVWADPSDLAARLDGQLAVWMACIGLNRVPWGASHGIGHQLGAVAKIPHGFCSCILLPHVLAYNRPVNEQRQRAVAAALGRLDQPAGEAVRDLILDLALPTRLRDVGVTREMMTIIAGTSLENLFVRQNPRPITHAAQVMDILEAAF